jgi:hypothetical protein
MALTAGPGVGVLHVQAQGCAVCTKTAADLNAKSARGLNGGILYLAAVPLLAVGTLGLIWWRRNGSAG